MGTDRKGKSIGPGRRDGDTEEGKADRKETKKARSTIKSRSFFSQRKSIFLIRSGHRKTDSKRALQEAAALFWEFTRTHTH